MNKATYSTVEYFKEIEDVENEQGYQIFLKFVLKYADSFCLSIYKNEKINDLEDFHKTNGDICTIVFLIMNIPMNHLLPEVQK